MTVNTITVGPGKLTIGADAGLTNFSSQIRSGKLVPSVDKGDPIHVLSGEEVPGERTEKFQLTGNVQQDFGAIDSRVEWLWEHRGETHDFEYVPSTAAGRTITGQLIVEAVDIGGDVKSKPTSDFAFDLVGEPVFDAIA